MLKEISYLERRIFVNASGNLLPVNFTNFKDLLEDCRLRRSDLEFLTKHKIGYSNFHFDNNGNLEDGCWITDVIAFKTFDHGHAKAITHKFDGDYAFEYEIIQDSEQIKYNIENFESFFTNNILAVLLF